MYSNNIPEDIKNINTVYIAGHINPDGDAVGSCFAFAFAMKKLGKKPVILLDKYDPRYDILNGREYIYTGDYDELQPDIFFALDCGSKERLGKAESVFDRAKFKYNIDHHISNSGYGDINIINGYASSASEIVYEIISKFAPIDKLIATAIYTGILTDTDGFMHNCTSERTHQIAGKLVAYGVDTPVIHSKILKEHSLIQAKVFAKAITNLVVENGISYTTLTAEEMKSCGADASDLDGIVEYILNINGVNVSMFATERKNNIVKLSFRSRTIDVNEVASLYGGGGHKLAAGASVCNKPLDIVVKEVSELLKTRLAAYEK